MKTVAALFVGAVMLAGCASDPQSAGGPGIRVTNVLPGGTGQHPGGAVPHVRQIRPPKIIVRGPARRYAWAERDSDPIANAATFTLVRGISPLAALRIVADDRKTPVESYAEVTQFLRTHGYRDSFVTARRRAGWTMVMEDNGYQATDPGLLRRLSTHGRAVVIYSNVDALCSFQYADHGHVIRQFDPLLYQTISGRPLPQERGIGFGKPRQDYYIAQSFALAERLTGFRVLASDVDYSNYPLAVVVPL